MITEKKTIRTTRTVTETEKRTVRRTSKIYLKDNPNSLVSLPPPVSADSGGQTQTETRTETRCRTSLETIPKVYLTDSPNSLIALPSPVSPVSPVSPTSGAQTRTETKTEKRCRTTLQTFPQVFSNTPAEGELQRGDVILSIGERNGDELTHKQAKDLIEGGGGQISLVLTRPPPGRHEVSGPSAPTFRTPAPVAPRTNPPKAMPYGSTPSAGHKPKKLNISRLGGGGPDFGSDYTRPYTTAPPQQASRPTYRPVGGQQGGQMLNRVQESLDNIIYSPRTPEGYQAPPFQPAPPPPFQPNMSMSGYAPVQQAPQQGGYRPTFEAVDSGQYSEEQEEFVPVWERRKNFQDQRPTSFKPARSTPIPKVPRPVAHHPDAPSFGTDYAAKAQPSSVMWTPQRAPPQQYQPPPPPSKPVQSEPPVYPVEAETIAPWRNTLRSTGIKPWDADLDYTSQQPTPSAPAPAPAPAQAPKPMKEGDRDWNASAVYRMIQQEEGRPAPRAPAPPPAPKPVAAPAPAYQPQQQYAPQGFEDELGVSDF